MKPKQILRMTLDIIMTILTIALMAYSLSGNAAHEIMGMALFFFYIIHHILNFKWYKSIFKGKYSLTRFVHVSVNLLLTASMLMIMISAMMISETVMPFLNFGSITVGRTIHVLSAYWGIILMSVHLGFHWNMMVAKINKKTSENPMKDILLKTAAALTAFYGSIAFVRRGVAEKLTLYYMFPYFNDGDNWFLVYLDFTAIIGLFVAVTYYFNKIAKQKIRRT